MSMISLPDEIREASKGSPPKDLVIISIPKMGKSSIFGDLTRKENAIVFDLERDGYEYISARRISIYEKGDEDNYQSYLKYLDYRDLLLKNKGKYKFLIIDSLTSLNHLAEIGATYMYCSTVLGKKFNRKDGELLNPNHPEWRSVIELPEGAGYYYIRLWFMKQFDIFAQVAPFRIWGGHIVDKFIGENDDKIVSYEINLYGKLKAIFCSRVTAVAKMKAKGKNVRILDFDVENSGIVGGSRAPHLQGELVISEMKDNKIVTYWDKIYNLNSKQ